MVDKTLAGSNAVVLARDSEIFGDNGVNDGRESVADILGLTVAADISNLGTGVATFLATPSSANLASAVTGETGSGALVFATSPTLVTPLLGTPTSGVLTNCTGYTLANLVGAGTAAASDTGDFGSAAQVGDHEDRITVLEAAGGGDGDLVERESYSNPASPWTPDAADVVGDARLDVTGLDHNLTIGEFPTDNMVNNVESTVELRVTASGGDRTLTISWATPILGTTPILVVPSGETRNYFFQCVDGSTWSLLGDALASETARGVVELATAAEVNTGTDAARPICPDQLAASYAGTRSVSLPLAATPTTDQATGNGFSWFVVPAALNGMNLVSARVRQGTAGTTGDSTYMVRRNRAGSDADMLSAAITVATATLAGGGTVNTGNDDLATDDIIYIDIDTLSTTEPQGGAAVLEFRLP